MSSAKLQPGLFYHIYNHANGSENLFLNENNYHYFLEKFAYHIFPVCRTYAYCLMPNHFHLLVSVRTEAELLLTFPKFETLEKLSEALNKGFISKQFSNLFSSYTQSFNKLYNRNGSLFSKNFKRIEIKNQTYFTRLIHYIHANPVHHGFCDHFEDWPYSSYQSFLSNKSSKLERGQVMEWFGDETGFKQLHKMEIDIHVDDLL